MAAMTPEADVMRLDELARGLGISITQAYELARIDALPLPAFKVGREWRFSRTLYAKLLAGEDTRPAKEV